MQSIIDKIKENIVDRIVEVFWVAIKAAVIAAIILLLLHIFPPEIKHDGWVGVRGDVGISQSRGYWHVRN
jgi:hypothetical protein